MSLIAQTDQEKLRWRFRDEVSGEVRLHLTRHGGACSLCEQADELLREIASLSERLALVVETGEGELPAIELRGAARGAVNFVGLPAGYEFPAFIDSIVDVSRGTTSLSPETVAKLRALDRRVHIQVFTSPT